MVRCSWRMINTRFPSKCSAALLRTGAYASSSEDIVRGRCAGFVADIGQSTLSATITPASVLKGELHAQILNDLLTFLTDTFDTLFRCVFVGNVLPILCQQCLRPDQRGALH